MKSNYIIKRAEKMGFCFGVKEAVELSSTIKSNQQKYMLGTLVHNKQVIENLNNQGIKVLEEIDLLNQQDELMAGDTVIIRAHGTTKEIYEILNKKKVIIYDTACVFVKRSRNKIVEHEKKGYKIIFIGDKKHPEVIGIISFGNNINVVKNLDELKKIKLSPLKKYYILEQTTLNKNLYKEIENYIKNNYNNCEVGNTICGATYERQLAVEKLAKDVEVVIVVGGINSSNTKKLYDISKKINSRSYFIQTEKDLDMKWFQDYNKIGITAGASTPDNIVKKIESILVGGHGMCNEVENFEELSFEEMLNQYEPEQAVRGEIVEGEIIKKEREYAYLDIKGKISEGILKSEEVLEFEIGDIIKVCIVDGNDDDGHILVSRKLVEQEEAFAKLELLYKEKEIVKGNIVKKVNGGYIVEILKQSTFMPNSLSQIKKDSTEDVIGNEIEVIIKDMKTEKNRKKILVSRRDVVAIAILESFSKLNENEVIEVEIKSVLKFGLSVKFENILGFIHISEISWGKVENLDSYNIGDKINAKIITLDKKNKSLKLSIKQLTEDPWNKAIEKYPANSIVDGEVIKIVKFGAFIKLEEGIEGLIHISDFSWNNKKINLDKLIKVNDQIKVKILELNSENKKLKLGLKQLSVDPWSVISDKIKEGDCVTGKVVDSKPYGVFVEIEEGIDAFIHISDFSWQKVENKLSLNDELELKIITIDEEHKKIKGGIKQLTKSPWEILSEELKIGSVVTKKVSSIADFGIFIDMGYGLDGMIHISQVSTDFVKNLRDKFEIGQEVTAEIIEMSVEDQKVKLSIKKVEEKEERAEHEDLLKKYGISE